MNLYLPGAKVSRSVQKHMRKLWNLEEKKARVHLAIFPDKPVMSSKSIRQKQPASQHAWVAEPWVRASRPTRGQVSFTAKALLLSMFFAFIIDSGPHWGRSCAAPSGMRCRLIACYSMGAISEEPANGDDCTISEIDLRFSYTVMCFQKQTSCKEIETTSRTRSTTLASAGSSPSLTWS